MKNLNKVLIFTGIAIIAGILVLISNQVSDNENNIQNMINEPIKDSGYFRIDKTQYNIGEKIFLDIDYIGSEDKGTILFLRPMNDTHRTTYMAIPFDGAQKESYSYYLEPMLDQNRGVCSMEDLVGVWSIVFYETNYTNIEFEIKNQISDWDDRTFEPIC